MSIENITQQIFEKHSRTGADPEFSWGEAKDYDLCTMGRNPSSNMRRHIASLAPGLKNSLSGGGGGGGVTPTLFLLQNLSVNFPHKQAKKKKSPLSGPHLGPPPRSPRIFTHDSRRL